MTEQRIITSSPNATQTLAEQLAAQLCPGSVVRLDGVLGAGKTCFVQGLARGLGVAPETRVHSPTFTLLNIYHGRLPLYHFDWYRVQHAQELAGLDLEEYFYGAGVVVVEWGEKFPQVFPAEIIQIRLSVLTASKREIILPAPFCLTRNS